MPALPPQVALFLAREITADVVNAALRAIRVRVVAARLAFKRLRRRERYFRRLLRAGSYDAEWAAWYLSRVLVAQAQGYYFVRLYYRLYWPYRLARSEVSVRYGLSPRARWEDQPPAVRGP